MFADWRDLAADAMRFLRFFVLLEWESDRRGWMHTGEMNFAVRFDYSFSKAAA